MGLVFMCHDRNESLVQNKSTLFGNPQTGQAMVTEDIDRMNVIVDKYIRAAVRRKLFQLGNAGTVRSCRGQRSTAERARPNCFGSRPSLPACAFTNRRTCSTLSRSQPRTAEIVIAAGLPIQHPRKEGQDALRCSRLMTSIA
jgi:hypothetical protein